MKHRLLWLILATQVLLVSAGFLVPMAREQAARREEIAEAFEFYPSRCYTRENTLILEGAFFNGNRGYHLERMESVLVSAADSQGNVLFSCVMGEKDREALRIPPWTNVAWDFTLYPHDPSAIHRLGDIELQLSVLMNAVPGPCTGEDCAHCHGQ